MMATFACALAVVLWWLFLSRAAWVERLGAIVLLAAAALATAKLSDASMWPAALATYGLPFLFVAFVAWAVATRHLPDRRRRVAMAATLLTASGAWTLLRTDGVDAPCEAEAPRLFSRAIRFSRRRSGPGYVGDPPAGRVCGYSHQIPFPIPAGHRSLQPVPW